MELTSGDTRISDPLGYHSCHIFCRNISERSENINFLSEMIILSKLMSVWLIPYLWTCVVDVLLVVKGWRHQIRMGLIWCDFFICYDLNLLVNRLHRNICQVCIMCWFVLIPNLNAIRPHILKYDIDLVQGG